jgi:ribose transport system substrate-binding protein
METKGLGPHGERAFPADRLVLSEAEAAQARAGAFRAAVVLHTTASDWSKHELDGIVATFSRHGGRVSHVVDCEYDKARQNRELMRLAEAPVDVVISLPIGASLVVESHRAVVRAGKKLVLLENAPSGLRPGVDYASLSSADNFGLGAIAADLVSPHVPKEGVIGILTYESEYFVTNEREIGFRKWMDAGRPDATIVRGRFRRVEEGEQAYLELLRENGDLDAIFVAWDVPALGVLNAMEKGARPLPIVTVDLGEDIAAELERGGPLKGIAAQRPYHQGAAAASAALLSLIGRIPPVWISSTGLKVTRENVRGALADVRRSRSNLRENRF